jgi:lipopolysaccharide transport system ATP-binding protein
MSLCTRGVLLKAGRLVTSGPTRDVMATYMQMGKDASTTPLMERADRTGTGEVRYTALGLEDETGEAVMVATSGRPITIRLDYETSHGNPVSLVVVGIVVRGQFGQAMFICLSRVAANGFRSLAPSGSIRCRIPELPLMPGTYTLDIWCKVDEVITDSVNHAAELTVSEGDFFGSGKLPSRASGEFLVAHEWEATEAM